MAWLHITVRSGRIMGGTTPPVVAESWTRCKKMPSCRRLASLVLFEMGFDVAASLTPRVWEMFPWEATAFLCMKKGGGRAGSSIETLQVRRPR